MATKTKEPRQRTAAVHLDGATFVKAWQQADDKQTVCEITGLSIKQASILAANMRKRGVPLKKFTRGNRYDYKDLAALAKSLNSDD